MSQLLYDVEKFDDGPGPTMADQQGLGLWATAFFMDKVNVNAMNPGDEVVKPVDLFFVPVPVKITHPVMAEFLQVSLIRT